jgi:hypothetical protein
VKYGVPTVTIELGTVLDAVIMHAREHVTVTEWKGMRLLADHDAFDRARPKLYLVRAKPIKVTSVQEPQGVVDEATDHYKRWHQREAARLFELAWTKPATVKQGRVLRLDYRSDKWNRKGRTIDYTHDFLERGGRAPLAYTDSKTLAGAKLVVVHGGSMAVTEAGIA